MNGPSYSRDSLCHDANFSCFSTDICRNVSLLRLKHTIHTYQLDIIFCGIKHGVFHDFDSSWFGLLRYKAHMTVLRVTWVVFNMGIFGNLEVRFCVSLLVGYNREPAC